MTTSARRPGRKLVRWEVERFLRDPPSIRRAAGVIVTMTTVVVLLSALAMRVFDPKDYPNYGRALWWALQTATTVGYGDALPTHTVGYVVGGVVMVEGIAFLAIVTAAITSTFVARAQRELGASSEAHLGELDRRLERIERALGIEPPPESPPSNDASAAEQLFTLRQAPRRGRRT